MLNVIEKQRKNQLERIRKNSKTKAIVYLREGINKLFQIYPKLFHNKSINLLERSLQEMKLLIRKCYTIDFLNEYGTPYNLLKRLINQQNKYK